MATSSVKGLISKMMADAGLRERLAHDSEGVLREYNLTSEEKAAVLSGSLIRLSSVCARSRTAPRPHGCGALAFSESGSDGSRRSSH